MELNPKLKKEMTKMGINLTAYAIHDKEFSRKGIFSRGYNSDEVDEFLDEIIKEYGAFYHLLSEYYAELELLRSSNDPKRTESRGKLSLEELDARLSKLERHFMKTG